MAFIAKEIPILLQDIDALLVKNDMRASYFGKRSVGNSGLVHRLSANGRVWPETEAKARSFTLCRAGQYPQGRS